MLTEKQATQESGYTVCPTLTSTGGMVRPVGNTQRSGALSPRQITALIQQRKWWPFDRVDGKILQKMHRANERKKPTTDCEEALL
jgi:hypothetical protein